MIGSIIAAVIIGAIIGVLGRLVVRAKQNISILATIIIGSSPPSSAPSSPGSGRRRHPRH